MSTQAKLSQVKTKSQMALRRLIANVFFKVCYEFYLEKTFVAR